MSTNRNFDRIAEAWLAEGPSELADRVLDAALDEVHLTHQRRRLPVPWRTPTLNTPLRLAAGIAIIAVVGYAGLTFLNPGTDGPGGSTPSSTPSPSPSPSARPAQTPTPTVNLDTTSWTLFTSERYGYTIEYPSDWEAEQAARDWSMEQDRTNWLSPAQDHFIDNEATYQIGVHGFAVDVPPGMTGAEWIDAYFEGTTAASACLILAADMPAVTVDGHPGKLADQQACSDTIAFVLIGQRMYSFNIGREGQESLFLAFLSTVHFTP